MPMELYSSEAFIRDIANAISESEGKPLNIGGTYHHGIDRAYAYQLIAEAKKAIEGQPVKQPRRAVRAAAIPRTLPKEAKAAIAAAKKARRPRAK